MILRSPNEMMKAAKEVMLGSREPETHEDWSFIFNFLANNMAAGTEVSACKLLRLMYPNPLTEEDVMTIAEFQAARKPRVK